MALIKTASSDTGDQSWLGSRLGVAEARTATMVLTSFTPLTHYPKGYLPSGLPLNIAAEGAVKPYTGVEGEVLGFLLTARSVATGDTKVVGPILRHGDIKTHRLPVAFTVPKTATAFTFITEENA